MVWRDSVCRVAVWLCRVWLRPMKHSQQFSLALLITFVYENNQPIRILMEMAWHFACAAFATWMVYTWLHPIPFGNLKTEQKTNSLFTRIDQNLRRREFLLYNHVSAGSLTKFNEWKWMCEGCVNFSWIESNAAERYMAILTKAKTKTSNKTRTLSLSMSQMPLQYSNNSIGVNICN